MLRLPRPDKTYRTFWRQFPDELALKEPAVEVVLPEAAVLNELLAELPAMTEDRQANKMVLTNLILRVLSETDRAPKRRRFRP